ncbi:MAG: ATP-binding protein [Acidimicrobiales bacterium]|nr:ATP-binding protein [Acidimicrobiales bacterium]
MDVPAGRLFVGDRIDPATGERRNEPVLLDSADLTTHGVIVGMTGSGKTGLAVALLEETLLQGIPCLMLDPKGDLANLLLTFPDLAPADFRPWIDEAQAAPGRGGRAWRPGASTASGSAGSVTPCPAPSTRRVPRRARR